MKIIDLGRSSRSVTTSTVSPTIATARLLVKFRVEWRGWKNVHFNGKLAMSETVRDRAKVTINH